jgi:putative addiction module killer protein
VVIEILLYQDRDGRRPVQEWFEDLDASAARKVQAALDQIASGSLAEVKSVGAGVLERRIHWGPGYRIYFGRAGATVVILLAGGVKQGQQNDIAAAHRRWADYKARSSRREQ